MGTGMKAPESLGNYGDAISKIYDLRDKCVPVAQILAALAPLDAPPAPAEDPFAAEIDSGAKAKLALMQTQMDAFIATHGLTPTAMKDIPSLEEAPAHKLLELSFAELQEIPFIEVVQERNAMIGMEALCLVQTTDGFEISLYRTDYGLKARINKNQAYEVQPERVK